MRGQRPGRKQACQHRHQPSGVGREAGGSGFRGRAKIRDFERQQYCGRISPDCRRICADEIPQKSDAMTTRTIQAIRGMNDILPDQVPLWEFFEQTVRDWMASYSYRNIRMPIVEQTDLFVRSIGEVTDIVEKEMYSFLDSLNGESLTLRPEGTASCVRAVLEHNLLYAGPQRLYYSGPMFRHERPQKGRYRQFHQYGVEALGFAGPDIDAELIVMCASLWRDLGIEGLRLELNTIGSSAERAAYRKDLVTLLERNLEKLDDDARRRLHTNPLRTLDSKNPMVQEVVAKAPTMDRYLGEASAAHFDGLKRLLDSHKIAYR